LIIKINELLIISGISVSELVVILDSDLWEHSDTLNLLNWGVDLVASLNGVPFSKSVIIVSDELADESVVVNDIIIGIIFILNFSIVIEVSVSELIRVLDISVPEVGIW
jgi:hypothetical protein